MYRAGLRELKLIYSSKPKWYFRQAERILTAILESYLSIFEPKKLLRALASPTFFDGLVASASLDELGGGATSIVAVTLKNFIRPDSGLAVVGGKRPHGYKVPEELDALASIFGFDEKTLERLKYASRMVAKVDSAAIQDGFQLYLHLMIVSWDGAWVIIQQGIKPMTNLVRRYHWISAQLRSFVEEPHSGIVSAAREEIVLDMTSRDSRESRKACVEAVNNDIEALKRFSRGIAGGQSTLIEFDAGEPRKFPLSIPKVSWSSLLAIHESSPEDYEALLAIRGVGPSMVRFLAAAAAALYDAPPSFRDPAILFSELPVKMGTDKPLYELVEAIKNSRLSFAEKRKALNRLISVFKRLEEYS
ncbi:MAG: DUF763 domain-containing protein [Nitrososphaerota archaeon]